MEASNGATLSETKRYLADGRFKPGSMKPKIEAIIAFLEANGRKAMVTCPGNMLKPDRAKTGTMIVN